MSCHNSTYPHSSTPHVLFTSLILFSISSCFLSAYCFPHSALHTSLLMLKQVTVSNSPLLLYHVQESKLQQRKGRKDISNCIFHANILLQLTFWKLQYCRLQLQDSFLPVPTNYSQGNLPGIPTYASVLHSAIKFNFQVTEKK